MSRGPSKDGRFYVEECFTCKVEFGMPMAMHEVAYQAKEKLTFYCPYGHAQVYVTGESEAAKLRRERDNAVQRIAEWQDQARLEEERRKEAEKALAVTRGQLTKTKKRVSGGVCPCCSRHFTALERHMHTKHPDYQKEPA